MDFNQFVGKKVLLSAMPNLRIEGKMLSIKNMADPCDGCSGCSNPWVEIVLDSPNRGLHGKTALVDCAMITCIVEME